MSWFSDVKNDTKLKQLALNYFLKTGEGFVHNPELANKILGKKDSMPLIEYMWRSHMFPLMMLDLDYEKTHYNVLEKVTSYSNCLCTPHMYESLINKVNIQHVEPESVVSSALFNWGYSKEIYKFNAEVVDAIKDSECREYDPSIFEKLPFDCFYIDCVVGKFDGAVIVNHKNSYANKVLTIVMIASDYPNGEIDWYEKSIGYDKSYTIDFSNGYEEELKTYLNLVNFLSCRNAKIVGTEHKYILDKKTNSRLTRSEPRKYEVDVVFENENQKKTVYHYLNQEEDSLGNSKAPHIRKAHWGKYWAYKRDSTGEIDRSSEKEAIFHWIPPVFINARAVQSPTIRHQS